MEIYFYSELPRETSVGLKYRRPLSVATLQMLVDTECEWQREFIWDFASQTAAFISFTDYDQ